MSTYRWQKRIRNKRGDWCLINSTFKSSLCGCGHRNAPPIKHRRRIVRRILERELQSMIAEET